MKQFIDVHDRAHKTFPEKVSKEEFAKVLAKYDSASREEGVVVLRTYVNLEEGRAWCLNVAADAEAVRRAHQRIGLPFDAITEVAGAAPTDLLLAK